MAAVIVVVVLLVVGGAVALSGGGGDDGDQKAASATTAPETTATTQKSDKSGKQDTTATTEKKETATTLGPPGGPCKAGEMDAQMLASSVKGANLVSIVGITNSGARRCTVNGVPSVALLGPNGQKLTSTTVTGGAGVPNGLPGAEVALDPGGQASFVMSWDQVNGSCLDVRSIDITLPGDTKVFNVQSSVTVCENGTVHLSSIQPGIVSV